MRVIDIQELESLLEREIRDAEFFASDPEADVYDFVFRNAAYYFAKQIRRLYQEIPCE
jgi:hypothetical protein